MKGLVCFLVTFVLFLSALRPFVLNFVRIFCPYFLYLSAFILLFVLIFSCPHYSFVLILSLPVRLLFLYLTCPHFLSSLFLLCSSVKFLLFVLILFQKRMDVLTWIYSMSATRLLADFDCLRLGVTDSSKHLDLCRAYHITPGASAWGDFVCLTLQTQFLSRYSRECKFCKVEHVVSVPCPNHPNGGESPAAVSSPIEIPPGYRRRADPTAEAPYVHHSFYLRSSRGYPYGPGSRVSFTSCVWQEIPRPDPFHRHYVSFSPVLILFFCPFPASILIVSIFCFHIVTFVLTPKILFIGHGFAL